MTARPLLVSNDPELIDDVVRLAAANAVEVHLATEPAAARSAWQRAPLVLVGSDTATALSGSGLGRRRDVVLVCREPSTDDWMHAVVVGAEHVVSLPEGERWLIDRLADTGEAAPRDGTLVAVVGAGGGSGASTFAATAAALAAKDRRTLLVDADPYGGGLDVVLGMEALPGVRWPDLAPARGRLGAQALADALPQDRGLHLLAWGREPGPALSGDVVGAVLDAAGRGFDLVLVDLPRRFDATTELVLGRAEVTAVVTATRIPTVAAAGALTRTLGGLCARVDLVARAVPRGLRDTAVADTLCVPLAATVPFERRLAGGAGQPYVPSARDGYGRACLRAVAALAPDRRP